ncbi:hypothetical protein [Butyrivibrio sp. VCB2006]|uniref:hypothetical protein n=1 Tax=Butyrivibrio sp. VCB2006 TaxID=1280679 RepID=UPI000416CE2C|nr:hypothetical protein [Butyrivibrio sp. VCB2006]
MISQLLETITSKYPLISRGSAGFDGIKIKGMTFTIGSYEAEGLGHVSTMSSKGFFGLMKMDTLIITPLEKDLPIFSYDRIKAMGNDKLYIELYDTMIDPPSFEALDKIKEKYKDLPAFTPGPQWYENIKLPQTVTYSGKKADSDKFNAMAIEYMKAFISISAPSVSDAETKQKKTDYYVDGLLNNGGPATDVFLKAIGKERTTTLFKEVLF